MRFRIIGKIEGFKKPQVIEKDFKDREAAKKYAEEYCPWDELKIREV